MQLPGPFRTREIGPMPSRDGCLTETELIRLIEGEVRLEQRDRWVAHLDSCPECRMVMAESSEHLETVAATRRRDRRALSSWVMLVALAVCVALVVLWALRA